MKELINSKKGVFINPFRNFNIGTFFIFLVMSPVVVFIISYFIKQIFGTPLVKIGTPLQLIIVATGLVILFYVIVKQTQGNIERGTIFSLILVLGTLAALYYFLPRLTPEIFSTISLPPQAQEPFTILSNLSITVHDSIQSVIPIP